MPANAYVALINPVIAGNIYSNKVSYAFLGQSGYGLAANLLCRSNTIWTCFNSLNADLVSLHYKHETELTTANIHSMVQIITNACPNAEVQWFGTPPAGSDPFWPQGNAAVRSYCLTHGWCYVDLASQVPGQSTNWMSSQNPSWFIDDGFNLHCTDAAYRQMLRPYLTYWGWVPNPTGSGLMFILTWPTNDTSFTLQFTTNLASPMVWTPVSETPVVVDGQNTVTDFIADPQRFYRLTH